MRSHFRRTLQESIDPGQGWTTRLRQDARDIPRLNPDEFIFLMRVAAAVSFYRMPIGHALPPERAFELENEMERVILTEGSELLITFAVYDQCYPDTRKFLAVMWRWLALVHLRADRRMRTWEQDDASGTHVHEAVLRVAAVAPLNSRWRFTKRRFFADVHRLAHREASHHVFHPYP